MVTDAPKWRLKEGFGSWRSRYTARRRRPHRSTPFTQGVSVVSGTDKANNKIQDLGGKAKEAVGKVTGDKSTENEGKGDQAKSSLKDAGEKVKDVFKK